MLTDLLLRLRSLFRRDAVERELDEEIRWHFEQLVESFEQQGLPRAEAERRARISFGGIDQIKEEHRDARGVGAMADLGRDVRHAFRQCGRAPGFAALAIVCLGLGIGVNTAIFGVINAAILKPLPVAEPDRVVWASRNERSPWSYPEYRDARDRTRALSGLAMALPMESDIDVSGDSSFIVAEVVTANYGRVIGLEPALGRWMLNDRESAAVISHAIWERHFNRDPGVLGRTIQSESESYTIVGVAPQEYIGVFAPLRTDLWVPVETRSKLVRELERGGLLGMVKIVGRLRVSATPAQASAELNAIDTQLPDHRGRRAGATAPIVVETINAVPDPAMRRRVGVLTTLLAAVVGLVLLIACVNVSNLLLVRGALRQRELAVRRALGASSARLLQQLMTESLVLAAGGAICGVLLAVWTNRLLERSVPPLLGGFPLRLNSSIEWRSVLFAAAIAMVATILAGLLPAWRASRTRALVSFKNEIGAGPPRRRPVGLVAQVVMSLALLFVAGSFLQVLQRLHATDPGFDVNGRLYAYTFSALLGSADSRRAFYAQVLDRLRGLPGVTKASLTTTLPLLPTGSTCISFESGAPVTATSSEIDVDYFETMGIGRIEGREFEPADATVQVEPVIVNAALASRLWPPGDAVGQRIQIGCKEQTTAMVVGVVRNSAVTGLVDTDSQDHVYRPFARGQSGRLTAVIVRTTSDPAALIAPVRQSLLAMGQGMRVYMVQPLSTHVEERYATLQWLTGVLTVFGLLALALAAVGLYGALAYRVARRTREIGVRMALGARRADVFREVLRSGLNIVLVGVLLGELATLGLTRIAGSFQQGVGTTGVAIHFAVALIWIGVALAACYLPAARAARLDPLTALRHE